MLVLWCLYLISFTVHGWNLQCGESGVKLTIPAADLQNLTGVADHRLLHMGAQHYDRSECRAYLDPEEGTIGFTYELDNRCGTTALVKCHRQDKDEPTTSGCHSAAGERKIHYTNEIYANPMLMYSLIGFGPRFAGTAASRRVFTWECVYDTHYAIDLELPPQNGQSENVPDELVYSNDGDGQPDYMKLSLNVAAFNKPTFDVQDLMPKYEMSASYGHQFYVIDGDWVSTQIVMSHRDKSHAQMDGIKTSISHCWLSDMVSPIWNPNEGHVEVIKHGCSVDEQRAIVYDSALAHVNRFAWRTDLTDDKFRDMPLYLHCEIRVCFATEKQCPTMCTDAYWTEQSRSYTPLQLHTTLGPFLRSDSSLIDASIMREVEPETTVSLVEEINDTLGVKESIENSSSPPVLSELKFDRDLPVWGKALIGTLTVAVVRK